MLGDIEQDIHSRVTELSTYKAQKNFFHHAAYGKIKMLAQKRNELLPGANGRSR